MTASSSRSLLVATLIQGYQRMRRRLAARLGSADLASEALHETWIDFTEGREPGLIVNPDSYVYRAALNTAHRLRRAEQRYLDAAQVETLFNLADDAPGPDRIVEGQDELRRLERVLDGLTKRQRVIFIECYLRDGNYPALAERFGVSERTVRSELREALLKVVRQMAEKNRFKNSDVRISRK